jgi:sulfite oxidase
MTERPKHPRFDSLSDTPWNGEPPADLLVESSVTPNELFYVRNHAPVPEIDPAGFRLEIGGRVERALRLSVDDLRADFPVVEVQATLQCAGNRRDELIAVRPIPGETPWGRTALGNARWRGAPLSAVLRAAGVEEGHDGHVEFIGLDEIEKEGKTIGFGASIPLSRALRSRGGGDDVLLAYEMNGEPLEPVHGFPLRTVVPGYIGARSVKWVGRVTVQDEPSDNYYQARSYKLFPPHIGPDSAEWPKGLMLGELSVTSALCSPAPGEEVPAGTVELRGYAMAGGERTVERVEVSTDGGESWIVAELGADHQPAPPGVWSLWKAEVELPAGEHEIVCRAWDSSANTQPESVAGVWNFKGYMNHAWHRVTVRCV